MMESEWRQVRRKPAGGATPATKSKGASEDLTSFYVSNLPGDACRKELWKPCVALSNLTDIYIAGRRNSAGVFFAFVKYSDVKNQAEIDDISKGLKEVVCRGRKLEANCPRHPKRNVSVGARRPVPVIPRGGKSFAEAAKGVAETNLTPTVNLEGVPEIRRWADKSVLVGEVRNLDTLCNFPSLLDLEGYDVLEVKYVGGLHVAVKFKSERNAANFKANKCIWMKWFVWVDLLEKAKPTENRVAWVKIVGVPMLAFYKIGKELGMRKVMENGRESQSPGKLYRGAGCKSRNHRRQSKPVHPISSSIPVEFGSYVRPEASRVFNRPLVHRQSRSFENSYISENPRTPKPLTFSKNRLRGAKNRSNISMVAKNFFRKNDFFFVQIFFFCICAQSLYSTYLKGLVKKNLKENAKKKKIAYMHKNKKKLHICKTNCNHYKRFVGSRSRFFERNNSLGDIGNWGSSRSRSFENSYIPENPRTPKPLTFSKNRLRGAKNRSNISPVAKKFFPKKRLFFFQKTLHIFLFCFKTAKKHNNFVNFFYRSFYNTYLKRVPKSVFLKGITAACKVGWFPDGFKADLLMMAHKIVAQCFIFMKYAGSSHKMRIDPSYAHSCVSNMISRLWFIELTKKCTYAFLIQ
ncbi:hypothetical protein LXL04_027815 [Taraxacum kok-saghyz]